MQKTMTSPFGPLNPCPRCGGIHESIDFQEFTQPMKIEGFEFTHFGFCPANGQPILRREADWWEMIEELKSSTDN